MGRNKSYAKPVKAKPVEEPKAEEKEPKKRKKRTKETKNQPIASRGAVTVRGFVLQEWQRLPAQLLQQHCQKEKRPRFLFRKAAASAAEPDRARARVVLPDAKNDAKTLSFCPQEAFETVELAQQHACLLALHHLVGPLSFERQLPDPFRAAWLSLRTANPVLNPQGRFVSDYERQQAGQKRREIANKKETRAKVLEAAAVNKLNMSDEHRQMVERVLQNVQKNRPDTVEESSSELSHNDVEALVDSLSKLGFAREDALQSVTEAPNVNADIDEDGARTNALEWLLLNLPEQRLPKQFAVNGDSMKVVVRGVDDPSVTVLQRLRRLGFPALACKNVQSMELSEAKESLWLTMIEHLTAVKSIPSHQFDAEELNEELMALEAIYDQDFVRHCDTCWSLSLSSLFGPESRLTVSLPRGSRYPHSLPIMEVYSAKLSLRQQILLQQALVVHAQKFLGCPFTHELLAFLDEQSSQVLKSGRPNWPNEWLVNDVGSQAPAKVRTARRGKPKPTSTSTRSSMAEERRLSASLRRSLQETRQSEAYSTMLKRRKQLPMFSFRQVVCDSVRANAVVVISAETGSGKSTQVPSFLLDDAIERDEGGKTHIICTQPRRISAIGLANRVAAERCEGAVGESVGYRIRLESKVSSRTRLEFVTVGILLRRLMSDPDLEGVSHLVVDEVHERSTDIDILLLIARRLLLRNKRIRLLLMSATLNADVFSRYFGSAPILKVPGRTFPVELFYVEDVIEATQYKPSNRYRKRKEAQAKDADLETSESLANDWDTTYSEATLATIEQIDFSRVNVELVESAVVSIFRRFPSGGGVLVFLPGLAEISALSSSLRRLLPNAFLVPLHSTLSPNEQSRVFSEPPCGQRKLVLSTNIAETSVTVPDVEFVVDSCFMRETRFDASRSLSMLVETHVSLANASQRSGRAGRVRAGRCWRLLPRSLAFSLPAHHRPELHRTSLEHVVLQLQTMNHLFDDSDSIDAVLREAVEPPPSASVRAAVKNLKDLSALDAKEALTSLGRHLARLPIGNVRLGRMLIYACCFQCVTPLLAISALLSTRSPFFSPIDRRDEAKEARLRFSAAGSSDHLTLYNAFCAWSRARQQGRRAEREFCDTNYLSSTTLFTVSGLVRQFSDALRAIGFVRRRHRDTHVKASINGLEFGLDPHFDVNARDLQVVQSVLCAGLYPNIIRVQHPEKRYQAISSGAIPKVHDPKTLKFFTKDDGRVFLHPSSVNFTNASYYTPWLVFLEKRQTSKVFIYDSTMVSPYALLLFGGKIGINHERSMITVDDWIKFGAPARIAVLVRGLRHELDVLLDKKASDPSFDLASQQVIQAMLSLISSSGFSQ